MFFTAPKSRIQQVSIECQAPLDNTPLRARYVRSLYNERDIRTHEELFLLLLNQDELPIKTFRLAKKEGKAVSMSRKKLVELLKAEEPYALIISHNHPNNRCNPSMLDCYTTEEIELICEDLNIKFLDHLIVGHNKNYYSFRDRKVVGC